MSIKEVKTLFFICDMCQATKLLRDVMAGTLPEGWTTVTLYAILDGYTSAISSGDLTSSGFGQIKHYCQPCSHKREVREVFK